MVVEAKLDHAHLALELSVPALGFLHQAFSPVTPMVVEIGLERLEPRPRDEAGGGREILSASSFVPTSSAGTVATTTLGR